MIWFARLFPAFMLLWPAVFTLFVRPRRSASEARARTARLWWATGAFLVLHAGVEALLETQLPERHSLRVGWVPFISVCGSMLLWFSFAMPALQARQPGWNDAQRAAGTGGRDPRPAVRSASLQPRHVIHPIPRRAWAVGWSLCGLCTAAMIWSFTRGVTPWVAFGLSFWVFSGYFGGRLTVMEPEPLDPRGSPELQRAYARLRSFKAWGLYWFGLSGTTVFTAVAVILAVRPDVGGWVGAILGCAIGVAGGVFGTVGSIRRAGVNALLAELDAAAGDPGGAPGRT